MPKYSISSKKLIHVCIAPEHSRRFIFWENVVENHGGNIIHISYIQFATQKIKIHPNSNYYLRIESPGEDFDTYKFLLQIGANSLEEKEYADGLKDNFGAVSHFSQWYNGWKKILNQIELFINQHKNIHVINAPNSISAVFDKFQSQQHLKIKSIHVPFSLGQFFSYHDLIEKLNKSNIKKVFLKPFYGSSASGIMALHYINPDKMVLYSTIKIDKNNYYNSLKLQKYHNPVLIEELISAFSKHDYFAEKWISKWRFNKYIVDFRVVVINGRSEFIVPRATSHFITNIHLGNIKLPLEVLNIDKNTLQLIKLTAEKAVLCYHDLMYAGVDILLARNKKVYVIEINAFGDLLLNTINKEGKSVYEIEYEALVNC